MLLSNKREQTIDTYNQNESPENYAEWKKSQSQQVTYYVVPFLKHYWNDKIIELENKLVIIGIQENVEAGGNDYKRVT